MKKRFYAMHLYLCYFCLDFHEILLKCRTKTLGMINTILGSLCLFLNWEGADIQPQIRPWKSPVDSEFPMYLWCKGHVN